MTAGIGFILMMLALGFGVVQGSAANGQAVGMGFAIGLALFVIGVIGWVAVVQPFKNFDDINIPKEAGNHAHEEHPAEDSAIVEQHH
jgi:hypothetical protein